MSETPAYIAEGSPSATNLPVDVIGRASPDVTTTVSTTIASATTTTLVVASGAAPFPQSGSFPIRALTEEMLVTGGQGTGSWTVTRGINGTTPLASIPATTIVALLVGVQRVEPVYAKKQITFKGRAASFMIPGRAGTTGQKLATIFNAVGSNVLVDVDTVLVDLNSTAARIVQPPQLRLYKITAAPTGGSTFSKTAEDSTLTTSGNVTLLQDASTDNTSSGTALAATTVLGVNAITQCFPSQLYTVAGFAAFDPMRFFPGESEFFTLNAGEGIAVTLDYTASASNPTSDRWSSDLRWLEYTNA